MTDKKQQTPNLDDFLAEFTDRVLGGETTLSASSADDELRSLEETILFLQQTLPQEDLDEATQHRMEADLRSRAQSVERTSHSSWKSRQSRQRWTLAFTTIAILAAIFLAIPLSLVGRGNVQGTAGLQPQSILLVMIGLGCIVALFIWLGRRQ